MLNLRSNLLALAIFVLVVLTATGTVAWRSRVQQSAVENLTTLGVDIIYRDYPEIRDSYPFVDQWFGKDSYASVERVNVNKSWSGDVEMLAASLQALPSLERVILPFEQPELVKKVESLAPGLTIEVAQPDDLPAPMAGGR